MHIFQPLSWGRKCNFSPASLPFTVEGSTTTTRQIHTFTRLGDMGSSINYLSLITSNRLLGIVTLVSQSTLHSEVALGATMPLFWIWAGRKETSGSSCQEPKVSKLLKPGSSWKVRETRGSHRWKPVCFCIDRWQRAISNLTKFSSDK